MRHLSSRAAGTGVSRRATSLSTLRLALAGGVVIAAACAAPPADEPAAAASTPAATATATTPAPSASATVASVDAAAVADTASMTVYKSPTCGCCSEWVKHVEEHGIRVDARDVADVGPIKEQLGVPSQLGSCHTAVIGGYVVEGHVPADVIKRMLREKPQIAGIAVPGMPAGSPGMEGDGSRKDRYDVIAIGRDGRTSVYATR